jgi:hypothetical protein
MTRQEQIRLSDHVVRLTLARGDMTQLPPEDRRELRELLIKREEEQHEQA